MVGSCANYHLVSRTEYVEFNRTILKPFTTNLQSLQTLNFRLHCLFDERSCMDHLDATMRHWLERVELVRKQLPEGFNLLSYIVSLEHVQNQPTTTVESGCRLVMDTDKWLRFGYAK
jgi:hypothetical protein